METRIYPTLVTCIEASKLSLTDEFMQYIPKNAREEMVKKWITEVIEKHIPDFYRPRLDPSMTYNQKLVFDFGKEPAMQMGYNWWEKKAKEFWPKRGSRLGTRDEYVAFVGVLIKKLIKDGWSLEEAWDGVCNDSRKLGNYWYSGHNAEEKGLALTGSYGICNYFDLANVSKILAKDESGVGFWTASGSYCNSSIDYPIAYMERIYNFTYWRKDMIGWIVFEK